MMIAKQAKFRAASIMINQDDTLFEVIATVLSAEDFEALVLYRELFGDYQFWVASPQNFCTGARRFTLVKAL